MTASTLDVPELITDECPRCQGDGYADHGYDDEPHVCEACGGTGEVELCSGCGEQPGVEGGLEVCGCTRAAQTKLLDAA